MSIPTRRQRGKQCTSQAVAEGAQSHSQGIDYTLLMSSEIDARHAGAYRVMLRRFRTPSNSHGRGACVLHLYLSPRVSVL